MAKKKKKKSAFAEVKGLKSLYVVGDKIELLAKVAEGEGEEEKTVTIKTMVRVTSVGEECLGLQIIGKSQRRHFLVGYEIEIEGDRFVVITADKRKGVVEYIPELHS